MKLKSNQLNVNLVGRLNKLVNIEMPINTSFRLAKIVKEINAAITIIEGKKAVIYNKYIMKDKSGKLVLSKDKKKNPIPGTYEVAEGKKEELNKALIKFNEEEIEVNISPISIKEFGDIKVLPSLFMQIPWLFSE